MIPARNPSADILEYRSEAQLRDSEIEAALASSRAIDRREAHLNVLVDETLESYRRFRTWYDEVIDYWSQAADRYDERMSQGLDALAAQWLKIFNLAVHVLDREREHAGIEPTQAGALRQLYSDMLSTELMDHGPMPERMVQATEKAAQDLAAGRGREM